MSNPEWSSGQPGVGDLGAIEVRTSFFPLAFILAFFSTRVHIDGGGAIEQKWGTATYPIAPGRHHVRAYCNYFIIPTLGDSSIVVDVYPGQVSQVHWSAPIWFFFMAGPFKQVGTRALSPHDLGGVVQPGPTAPAAAPMAIAPPAPGWHLDPGNQHQLRYWDGQQWTDHTSPVQATQTPPPAS